MIVDDRVMPAGAAPVAQHDRREQVAAALAVLTAFSVNLPAAALSISSGLFAIAWLACGRYGERLARLRADPVALVALVLFGLVGVAMLWSPVPWAVRLDGWAHYRALLLLVMLRTLLVSPEGTWRLLVGFVAGAAVALAVSYLRRFGVMPLHDGVSIYTGFGGHTGFSIMLALMVLVAAAWCAERVPARAAWALFGLLALVNLVFVNTGRTGHFTFLLMLPLLAHRLAGWRGVAGGIVAIVAVSAAAYGLSGEVRQRTDRSVREVSDYLNRRGDPESNDARRLDYYATVPRFIARQPVLGVGTGAFAPAYRDYAAGLGRSGTLLTANPHSDFLMFWAQQGIAALVLAIGLWVVQWRRAAHLPRPQALAMRALVVTMVAGGAVNSFLLDMMESHLYAVLTAALAVSWPQRRVGETGTQTETT